MPDAKPKRPERYLSGIQPSGQLHLGNYFGAIRQHLDLQQAGYSYYFIANYHALTTVQDANLVRGFTFEAAVTYLALGLDPTRSVFFRQSDVPEVTELTWLLMTVASMGELERAVSYKDKVGRGIAPSAGLFTYPVLMAADILAYDSTCVPVGADQIQHIEMTREFARAFNHTYKSEVFTLPTHRLSVGATVPGTDGQKMSKSYGNTIPLFTSGKALWKLVSNVKTDSTPVEAPKNPDTCNVFALYALFASETEKAEMAERYARGGTGYGEVKKALNAKIEEHFADARARREQLLKDHSYVEDVLQEGAKKARAVARATTDRARIACGVDR